MKKIIGALIGTALLTMPGAVFAYQGYGDLMLYSYTPAYGYGGAGYDYYGNYYTNPPSYPSYSYPSYSYQPTYSYPNYSYSPYQYQPTYYYPQTTYYYPQYSYPYIYNTNTNVNFNNVVNNNNSYARAYLW